MNIALAKVTNWYKVHAFVLVSYLAPTPLPPAIMAFPHLSLSLFFTTCQGVERKNWNKTTEKSVGLFHYVSVPIALLNKNIFLMPNNHFENALYFSGSKAQMPDWKWIALWRFIFYCKTQIKPDNRINALTSRATDKFSQKTQKALLFLLDFYYENSLLILASDG